MKMKKGTKLAEWQKRGKEGGVCNMCGETVKKLTVDHIIPKHLLEMLDKTGEACYEDEDNFTLICFSCNAFKANRIDIRDKKVKFLLQKYIDLI